MEASKKDNCPSQKNLKAIPFEELVILAVCDSKEESSIAILQSTQPSWNEEVVSVNETRSLLTSVLLGSSLVKCWDKKCILHSSHYMATDCISFILCAFPF